MTEHAYLPTTLISDKGSAFMSHVTRNSRSDRRPWYYSKARHYKACTNNWAAQTLSRVKQTSIED